MKIKYKDLYDGEFLEEFKEYRKNVEELELVDSYRVDVEAVAKACDIKLVYVDSEEEAGIDYDNRVAKVYEGEDDFEKRYNSCICIYLSLYRKPLHEEVDLSEFDEKQRELLKNIDEFGKHYFSHTLLLPEKLVNMAVESTEKCWGYDRCEGYCDGDIKDILDKTYGALGVKRKLLGRMVSEYKIFSYDPTPAKPGGHWYEL